jgi:hypothetical protein
MDGSPLNDDPYYRPLITPGSGDQIRLNTGVSPTFRNSIEKPAKRIGLGARLEQPSSSRVPKSTRDTRPTTHYYVQQWLLDDQGSIGETYDVHVMRTDNSQFYKGNPTTPTTRLARHVLAFAGFIGDNQNQTYKKLRNYRGLESTEGEEDVLNDIVNSAIDGLDEEYEFDEMLQDRGEIVILVVPQSQPHVVYCSLVWNPWVAQTLNAIRNHRNKNDNDRNNTNVGKVSDLIDRDGPILIEMQPNMREYSKKVIAKPPSVYWVENLVKIVGWSPESQERKLILFHGTAERGDQLRFFDSRTAEGTTVAALPPLVWTEQRPESADDYDGGNDHDGVDNVEDYGDDFDNLPEEGEYDETVGTEGDDYYNNNDDVDNVENDEDDFESQNQVADAPSRQKNDFEEALEEAYAKENYPSRPLFQGSPYRRHFNDQTVPRATHSSISKRAQPPINGAPRTFAALSRYGSR